MPPKGLRQRVRVVRDHGEVVMSVGPVRLAAGVIFFRCAAHTCLLCCGLT